MIAGALKGLEQMVLFCMIAAVVASASVVSNITTVIIPEKVYPIELMRAEILCEEAGGVEYLEYDYTNFEVYCKNGSIFENTPKWGGK